MLTKRKRFSKRSAASGEKAIRRYYASRVARPITQDTKVFKITTTATYSSGTTEIVNIMASSGSGVIAGAFRRNAWSFTAEFQPISSLFDFFRVISMNVQSFPIYQAASASVSWGQTVFYYDWDTTTPVASTGLGLEYENKKVTNLATPMNFKVRVPKVTALNSATASSTFLAGGWEDLAAANSDTIGGIFWYGSSYSPSQNFATIYCDFIVEARYRR